MITMAAPTDSGDLVERLTREVHDHKRNEAFFEFIDSNPDFYDEAERMALRAYREGRRISAQFIIEYIRWNTPADYVSAGDFKVNNEDAPMLSRVLTVEHPELAEVFEFRQVNGQK